MTALTGKDHAGPTLSAIASIDQHPKKGLLSALVSQSG